MAISLRLTFPPMSYNGILYSFNWNVLWLTWQSVELLGGLYMYLYSWPNKIFQNLNQIKTWQSVELLGFQKHSEPLSSQSVGFNFNNDHDDDHDDVDDDDGHDYDDDNDDDFWQKTWWVSPHREMPHSGGEPPSKGTPHLQLPQVINYHSLLPQFWQIIIYSCLKWSIIYSCLNWSIIYSCLNWAIIIYSCLNW